MDLKGSFQSMYFKRPLLFYFIYLFFVVWFCPNNKWHLPWNSFSRFFGCPLVVKWRKAIGSYWKVKTNYISLRKNLYQGKLPLREKSLLSSGTSQVFWRSQTTVNSNHCLISTGILCKLDVNLFKQTNKQKCKKKQEIVETICILLYRYITSIHTLRILLWPLQILLDSILYKKALSYCITLKIMLDALCWVWKVHQNNNTTNKA